MPTRERKGRKRSVFLDGSGEGFMRDAPQTHRGLGRALASEIVSSHPQIQRSAPPRLQLPAASSLQPALSQPLTSVVTSAVASAGSIARGLHLPTARDSGLDARMSLEEGSSKLCAARPAEPISVSVVSS